MVGCTEAVAVGGLREGRANGRTRVWEGLPRNHVALRRLMDLVGREGDDEGLLEGHPKHGEWNSGGSGRHALLTGLFSVGMYPITHHRHLARQESLTGKGAERIEMNTSSS